MRGLGLTSGLGLTKVMVGQLLYMLDHSGFSYSERNDRTMVALATRNLVGWSRGGKYGKSHWTLTDFGTDIAKHLRAKKLGRPHAVFLTPTEYDVARRGGADMLDFVLVKKIPSDDIDRIVQAEIDRNDRVKPDYSGGVKTGWDAFADAIKAKHSAGEN